jgi:hypothetical protein
MDFTLSSYTRISFAYICNNFLRDYHLIESQECPNLVVHNLQHVIRITAVICRGFPQFIEENYYLETKYSLSQTQQTSVPSAVHARNSAS